MRRQQPSPLPDPYADLSVHGTLPFVIDPADPCGVRFARLGGDPPEACLTDPATLPPADLAIHVFRDREARDLFTSTIAEFAGNAVRWTVPDADAPPLALVARLDAAPTSRPATMSEAVRLVAHGLRSSRRPLAEEMAEGRQHVLRMLERGRADASSRERWGDVIEALRGIVGVGDVSPGRDGGHVLVFEIERPGNIAGRSMAVWRVDAETVVGGATWGGGMMRRSPEPMAELARFDDAAGLVPGPSGMVGLPLSGGIVQATVGRAVAALDAREELVARLRADKFLR